MHVDRLFRRLLAMTQDSRPRLCAEACSGTHSNSPPTIVRQQQCRRRLTGLNSLAEGGEVIVSRGELVEIGGSFRIPDVMQKSQAQLREVGTTNRTRLGITNKPSTSVPAAAAGASFQLEITGFTEQARLDELVGLRPAPPTSSDEDLGSGALFDLRSVELTAKEAVLDSLRAGVERRDLQWATSCSAARNRMISGRADLVARMRSNSLFRALRVDKLT